MTAIDIAPFRTAIEQKICSFCVDRHPDGSCGRPQDDPCALISHLDVLVDTILRVGRSDDIGDYVRALRSRLCPSCHQDASGDCALRNFVDCALDSYLLRVVEVIEETATSIGQPPGAVA